MPEDTSFEISPASLLSTGDTGHLFRDLKKKKKHASCGLITSLSQLTFYGLTSCSRFLGSCGHSQPLEPCVYKGTRSAGGCRSYRRPQGGSTTSSPLWSPRQPESGRKPCSWDVNQVKSARKDTQGGSHFSLPLESSRPIPRPAPVACRTLRKRPKYLCSRRLGDFLTHSALGNTIF